MTEHRRERDAFIGAAAQFCGLYESAKELGSERLLLGLAAVLPRLQAAAVELPYPDDDVPADDLDARVTEEEMGVLTVRVAEVLDEIDFERIREDDPVPPGVTADEAIELLEGTRESLPEAMDEATDWSRIHDNLHTYLPQTRPSDSPETLPVGFFLYEDLADTYRDLKSGFRLLEAGRPEAEAVFEWRLGF